MQQFKNGDIVWAKSKMHPGCVDSTWVPRKMKYLGQYSWCLHILFPLEDFRTSLNYFTDGNYFFKDSEIEPYNNQDKKETMKYRYAEVRGSVILLEAFSKELASLGYKEGNKVINSSVCLYFDGERVKESNYSAHSILLSSLASATNTFFLPEQYKEALEYAKLSATPPKPISVTLEIGNPKKVVLVYKDRADINSGNLSKNKIEGLLSVFAKAISVVDGRWSITPTAIQIGCSDGINVTKQEVELVLETMNKL
jgi:hypothetical protein